MTRGPVADGKQPDLFGAVPEPAASKARAAHPQRAGSAGKTPPSRDGSAASEDGITGMGAKLSPAELEELAAVLSDAALACLVLAAARQLRRRLVRGGGRKGQRPSPALERAARQLVAELDGAGLIEDT